MAVDNAQVWAHAPDDQLAAIASGRGDLADSARAEQQRRIAERDRCPRCRGTGGGTYNDCPTCDGNGVV